MRTASASWRIPSLDMEEEEETWGVAGTTEATVGMPSGYGAYKGNITPVAVGRAAIRAMFIDECSFPAPPAVPWCGRSATGCHTVAR